VTDPCSPDSVVRHESSVQTGTMSSYHSPQSPNATEHGQGLRSLYGKGPAFTLDNFSSKDFIVKDFIESLTDAAQPSSRRSQGPAPSAFDSKPLIRAFEQASKRLNELSEELEAKETELSGAVRSAEAQHTSNIETLGRKLNRTINSFQQLDSNLTSDRGGKWGGNVAVETGKTLEELDRQRRRAMDAHFLIECWDEVSNRGEVTLLENLRRSGTGEGKIRSARIAKQLLRISQRLDPSSHGHGRNGNDTQANGITNGVNGTRHFNTREIIEKFVETLENDMLKLFDDFYRRQNFEEMKNCATVLQDFNGGASVQAAFVNQHQFFIDRSNLVTDEVGGDQETWVRLSDPDADLPGVEPGLQSLIDEVRLVVQEESQIIKRAFPYPDQVLGKFVQRVFQQSLQQRLELVLDKAESESTLAYLRSLQAARNSINSLVEDLKLHGLTEHPDPVTSQTSQLLDQQLDELFTPYFGGSAYIDKEKQNLSELYRSLLFKFELFHSRRQKEPKTYLASLRARGQEMLTSAREATDVYVKSLDLEKMSSTQKRILLSVAGLKNTAADETTSKPHEVDLSETDGRLQTQFAKRMLKWLAEGVRRGLELSGGSETPKDVSALHSLLLRNLGENYVELSLDAAAESASTAETARRDAPDLSYLSSLKAAISIMHLMQSCTNTLLIPLASTSLTIRHDMEKNARSSLLRMEDHINIIEQRTIDAVLNWTSRLLTNQNRIDFRPREIDADTSLAQSSTPTCASILKFLSTFHTLAKTTFTGGGANLTNLLSEIGVEFRGQLLEHFKRYQVNRLGAIMLVRDISAYVDLLRAWDLGLAFNGTLEVLVEIGSLFVLKPEAIKERIKGSATASGAGQNANGQGREGGQANGTVDGGAGAGVGVGGSALANVSRENLRPYLLKREDYMEVGMQNVLYGL